MPQRLVAVGKRVTPYRVVGGGHQYEQAASIMERVLTLQAGHPEARYYLGMSYRQLGRLEDARRQLEIHESMVQAIRRSAPVEKQVDP